MTNLSNPTGRSFAPRPTQGTGLRLASGLTRAAALLVLFGLSGCGVPTKLARVGGQTITDKQLLDYVETTPAGAQSLEQIIAQQAVLQKARDENVAPTSEQVQQQIDQLKATNPNNPQLTQLLTLDRVNFMQQIRVSMALQNLIKKSVDMSDAAKQKWFQAHQALFNQPAKASIQLFVFSDANKASTAKTLLEKGSAAADVATLADPSFPQNGEASPSVPEADIQQEFAPLGPQMSHAIGELFAPGVRDGVTLGPFSANMPGSGPRYAVIRLVSHTPAKSATYQGSEKQIEQIMPLDEYATQTLHSPAPAAPSASYYAQLGSAVDNRIVQDILQADIAAKKITVYPPYLKNAFNQQFTQQAPGAGPAGPGIVSSGPADAGAPTEVPAGPAGPAPASGP